MCAYVLIGLDWANISADKIFQSWTSIQIETAQVKTRRGKTIREHSRVVWISLRKKLLSQDYLYTIPCVGSHSTALRQGFWTQWGKSLSREGLSELNCKRNRKWTAWNQMGNEHRARWSSGLGLRRHSTKYLAENTGTRMCVWIQ